MSNNIQDKIINHLVAYYLLVEVFDKTFIDTTVATRVGKGTHLGLYYTKKYINDMKRIYKKNIYYLKFCENEIKKFLVNLKLELNDNKTRVDSIKNALDFLCFKFYIQNNKILVKVRNNTKKKFKKKMKKLNYLVENNLITKKERDVVFNSFYSHRSCGNCGNLVSIFGLKNNNMDDKEFGENIFVKEC